MARFAVSVFGRDRPGIVAAVTRVLADDGCSLEDTSMTILRGHFAMMLVGTGPDERDAAGVQRKLSGVARQLDLQVAARPIHDDITEAPSLGERHVIAVYGIDRPGLVARVAEALAAHEVNITDLVTRVIGEPDPVYVMHFEVEVPPGRADEVRAALDGVAAELEVEIRMHADEPDLL